MSRCYNTFKLNMSGHSKWSTIKRQKAANDSVKGKVFGKLVKGISVAVKTGGGSDPNMNPKLRMAIDAAKAFNMPKENIDRAINKASSENENIEEILYEGFGPFGVGILIEAATDNRNRTGREIKNLLDKSGGSLGQPGSVSHGFSVKGLITIKKEANFEDQLLKLIDLGINDFDEADDAIEIYTNPTDLWALRTKIEESGVAVLKSELVKIPAVYTQISEDQKEAILNLLSALDEHDDVQNVYTNADF